MSAATIPPRRRLARKLAIMRPFTAEVMEGQVLVVFSDDEVAELLPLEGKQLSDAFDEAWVHALLARIGQKKTLAR